MPDIGHQFPIRAPLAEVFEAVSTAKGLNAWWTKDCVGEASPGVEFQLKFGPEHEWRAIVSRCVPDREFELKMTAADKDWLGSHVTFLLNEKDGATEVHFRHSGWPKANEHYHISCFCWAMYLRLLKRYVEFREVVPYENRLNV